MRFARLDPELIAERTAVHGAILAECIDAGIGFVRVLQHRILENPLAPSIDEIDRAAVTLDRVARALRRTIILEQRINAGTLTPPAPRPAPLPAEPAPPEPTPSEPTPPEPTPAEPAAPRPARPAPLDRLDPLDEPEDAETLEDEFPWDLAPCPPAPAPQPAPAAPAHPAHAPIAPEAAPTTAPAAAPAPAAQRPAAPHPRPHPAPGQTGAAPSPAPPAPPRRPVPS